MEPIISPWLIWLMQTSDSIKVILYFVGAFSAATFIMILLFHLFTIKDDDFIEQNKASKKYIKISLIIATIASVTCIFVPDKKTVKEIIITSYATEDNVNAVAQNGKEAID